MTLGQSHLKIIGTPAENFGYLKWQNDDPNVEYHRYEIKRQIITSSDTTSVTVSRGEIWRDNYLWIPVDYWSKQAADTVYSIHLKAVDASHEDLDHEIVNAAGPNTGLGQVDCFWECVSSTYAFKIQQYNTPHGTYNYRLESTTFRFSSRPLLLRMV